MYVPFEEQWKKEMSKATKKAILDMIDAPVSPKLKKSQLIDLLKVELIVKRFNENYPVGSKVGWRSVALDSFPYNIYEVSSPAFITSSNYPVVFFKDKLGYCSIEPKFICDVKIFFNLKIKRNETL